MRIPLSLIPIPVLIILITVIHLTVDPSVGYEPRWLLPITNTLFVTVTCVAVAYIAMRAYRASGRTQFLLLGCGVLIFGIGGALAGFLRSVPETGANLNVTIYNTGALVGGLFHFVAAMILLSGISPEIGSERKDRWLILGYGGATVFMGLLAVASLYGLIPPFKLPGQIGFTLLRQQVLGAADILFIFSFLVFMGTYLRNREVFLYWYSCALALTAISLTAFFVQGTVGSPIGWVGRCSQYLGGVYFLIAILTARRSAQARRTSIDAVLTASLSPSEEKFRALAENSPDIILRFDVRLRHIYVNPAGLKRYGKPAESVLGMTFEQMGLAEAYTSRWQERIQTVFQNGKPVEAEDFAGDLRYYQSRCVPEYGADGSVANVLVVSRDLTDRKRAEAALRRSEERYRTLSTATFEGIAVTEEGLIVDANEQLLRLFGCTPIELLGRSVTEFLPPEDCERVMFNIREGIESLIEHDIIRKDGSRVTVEAHGKTIFDEDRPVRFTAIRDITERKRVEQALKDADRRKDEFLATLAHELRNPLAPISSGLQILRLAGNDRETVSATMEMMERQLRHMVRLIDDLLDLSRISRGKIELRKRPVELAAIVRQAVETSQPLIVKLGHEFSISFPAEPIFVEADVTRLAQVFANLIDNAAKYTDPGGRISLTAERWENQAVVRVKDNGMGIPPPLLSQVFEMFTQVDRYQGKSQAGLGIGLSLVKRLVEMHGGTVEAHSDGPGQGSEFVVRLPVLGSSLPENREPGQPEASAGSPMRRRVLVADDNVDAAASLSLLIEMMGHEVRTVHDGLAAVEMAAAFRPDLILLDIGMPRLDGHEACRRIRAEPWGRDIVIIAMTGWGQDADKRQSQSAGFTQHVVKPMDPAALEPFLAARPVKASVGSESIHTVMDAL